MYRLKLLYRLVCGVDERIGSLDELKKHPFFSGLCWERIRSAFNELFTCGVCFIIIIIQKNNVPLIYCLVSRDIPAPYQPAVKSIDDVSNFDDFSNEPTTFHRMSYV